MEPEGSLPHSQVPATCLYPRHLSLSQYLLIKYYFQKLNNNTMIKIS